MRGDTYGASKGEPLILYHAVLTAVSTHPQATDSDRRKASFYRPQEVGGKTLLGKDSTTAGLLHPDIADENMSTEELLS